MLIIPEIETVVLLVPRTGSSALMKALKARYPKASLLYRHMEADGIPFGYDRWRRIGVAREPVARLWSVYNFCKTFSGHDPGHTALMRESVMIPFEDWIIANETVFADPYARGRTKMFFPEFAVRHRLPENRKSQFVYLRPDLGTKVFRHSAMPMLEEELDVRLDRGVNATKVGPPPILTGAALDVLKKFHAWDIDYVQSS